MIKGEIFWAFDIKKHPHPVVFLEDQNEFFSAAILSSSNKHSNEPMDDMHFERYDERGFEYEIFNKPSYLVIKKFDKYSTEINPRVIGKLTDEGIRFITQKLEGIRGIRFPEPIWKLPRKSKDIS